MESPTLGKMRPVSQASPWNGPETLRLVFTVNRADRRKGEKVQRRDMPGIHS